MRRPSGDQAGPTSEASLSVRRSDAGGVHHVDLSVPVASGAERDARPSGDQAGVKSSAPWSVRRVTPEPSAFIT